MFQNLNPPPFTHQATIIDSNDPKVSQWIKPYTPDDNTDLEISIFGVPLSRSSISASGASESPLALRQSWTKFTTYDIDHEIDLLPTRVSDLGDVRMHTTDIARCHRNIELAMQEILEQIPGSIPLAMGGDHSITAPLVKAFCNHHSDKKVGLIQFDTHLDVRSLEDGGPSNGTPIRNLVQNKVLKGENIFQLGLHSFANSKAYRDYAKQEGITYFTMYQIRKHGLNNILNNVLSELKQKVDIIYLTIDIDILDQAVLPGSPGSSPGGMQAWELFEALHLLGSEGMVKAADIVCLDPLRDNNNLSVRTATHAMLSFISGYCKRAK